MTAENISEQFMHEHETGAAIHLNICVTGRPQFPSQAHEGDYFEVSKARPCWCKAAPQCTEPQFAVLNSECDRTIENCCPQPNYLFHKEW